jgi:MFS family permease
VIRDPLFYVIAAHAFMPSLLLSGLYFFHAELAAQKNWPIHVFAMAILAHSLTKTAVSVWAGRLADLIGPQRLFAWTLLPLCGSCWALVGMDSILGVWVYMALAGVSTGCLGPIHGAMWPQRYGIRHIGAINGLTRMIGIATTALSPFLFGQLLDRGVTFDVILLSSLALMLLLTGITFGAFRATRAGLTSFHRHE